MSDFEKMYGGRTIKRFLESKVMPEPNTGCWLWIGSYGTSGYGKFNHKYKVRSAHKTSYEVYNGKIKSGNVIRHLCDTAICINPQHLVQGTQKQNIHDKFKNYSRYGKSCSIKLSVDDVVEIRALSIAGMTYVALAKMYNVSAHAIGMAAKGRTWKHLVSKLDKPRFTK